MSQRPDSVPHRPEGVSQRPGSVPQRPDFLRFWQDIQDISGYPGGATARLRRALAPCRASPGGLAQSARGRWLNARKRREAATGHRVSSATTRPPLKCQHQQGRTGARSPARVTKTAPRPVDECAGSRSLLSAGGIESGSLTLEGQEVTPFFLAFSNRFYIVLFLDITPILWRLPRFKADSSSKIVASSSFSQNRHCFG